MNITYSRREDGTFNWTEECEEEFIRLWNAGISTEKIRKIFCDLSRSAVQGRVRLLRRRGRELATRGGHSFGRPRSRYKMKDALPVVNGVNVPDEVVTGPVVDVVTVAETVARVISQEVEVLTKPSPCFIPVHRKKKGYVNLGGGQRKKINLGKDALARHGGLAGNKLGLFSGDFNGQFS